MTCIPYHGFPSRDHGLKTRSTNMGDLLSPLLLSLRIAIIATAVVAAVGIPLAYFLARRRFFGRTLVETLLTVPLVLPPTVVGYLIILAVGVQSPIGQFLDRAFGYRLLFTIPGAILAAVIVSLPLLLLPARAAFAAIEPEYEEIARLFGAGRRSPGLYGIKVQITFST